MSLVIIICDIIHIICKIQSFLQQKGNFLGIFFFVFKIFIIFASNSLEHVVYGENKISLDVTFHSIGGTLHI